MDMQMNKDQVLKSDRKNKNKILSEKRAQSVANELMKQFNAYKTKMDLIIDVEINGRGETLPPNLEKSQAQKNNPERRISRVSMVLGPKYYSIINLLHDAKD